MERRFFHVAPKFPLLKDVYNSKLESCGTSLNWHHRGREAEGLKGWNYINQSFKGDLNNVSFFTLQVLAQQAGYYFKRTWQCETLASNTFSYECYFFWVSAAFKFLQVLTHPTLCYVDSSRCLEYATKCASYRHLLLFFLFFRRWLLAWRVLFSFSILVWELCISDCSSDSTSRPFVFWQ